MPSVPRETSRREVFVQALTREQDTIAASESNRLLINAGPGTGKTTALGCYALKQASMLTDGKVVVFSLTKYATKNFKRSLYRLVTKRKKLIVNLTGVNDLDRLVPCPENSA